VGYYPCSCHSEVVNIERDIEMFGKEDKHYDVSIYFAIYHYGTQDPRPTFSSKLRHCWQILKTGKNYPDNIILSVKEARKLAKELTQMSDEKDIKIEVEKLVKARKNEKK